MQSIFYFCSFIDITSASVGGAIQHELDSKLAIKNCIFQGTRSQSYGGSIYKGRGTLDLHHTCFIHCKTNTYCIDQMYGNTVFSYDANCVLLDNLYNACGDDELYSGDSVVFIRTGYFEVKYDNATTCIGYRCSSIHLQDRCDANSRIKMCTYVNCINDALLEGFVTDSTIISSNFVNNTVVFFATTSNTLLLYTSVIFRSTGSIQGSYTLFDCVCDAPLVGVTINAEATSLPIFDDIIPFCNNPCTYTFTHLNNPLKYHSFVFFAPFICSI